MEKVRAYGKSWRLWKKFAPMEKVRAYGKSLRLWKKFALTDKLALRYEQWAPRRKVGAYASFKKLPSVFFRSAETRAYIRYSSRLGTYTLDVN
jgi:hypothetical protein